METIIAGSLLISLFHAFLPNHWLPVLSIAKKENWNLRETVQATFLAGIAHAMSTILIGIIIALVASEIKEKVEYYTTWITPIALAVLGLFFIWQHYRHRHFHLHEMKKIQTSSRSKWIIWLVIAMFFSPCLEIEAFYLAAGGIGWHAVLIISVIYLLISVTGMVLWVRWAFKGLKKLNWHALEHNAGIVTGIILVLTGLSFFLFH